MSRELGTLSITYVTRGLDFEGRIGTIEGDELDREPAESGRGEIAGRGAGCGRGDGTGTGMGAPDPATDAG